MVLFHNMSKYGSKDFPLLIYMVNLAKTVHTVGYMRVHVDSVCFLVPFIVER
jgi:hypothetical protein